MTDVVACDDPLSAFAESGYGAAVNVASDRTNAMNRLPRLTRLVTPALLVSAFALTHCGKPAPAPAADTAAPAPAPTPDAAAPAPATTDAAPAAAADAAPAAEPAPADCVPNEIATVIGAVDPELARIEGKTVELCGLVEEARMCVSLDLETGIRKTIAVDDNDVKRIPAYPTGFDDGIIRDETRPVIKLCLSAETGCKDLHAGQILSARFDATRSQVVLTAWDDGMRKAKIYDTASLEQKSSFDISPGELPDCTFADFVGKNLIISTGACTGGGTSWILDVATGNKVADVGADAPFFIKDDQFAAVPQAGENVFAFRSADGTTVVLQDVVTGAVSARLNLEEAVGDTTPKHDGAWVLTHELGLVLVESRPVPDSIYLVDAKTLAVIKAMAPRPCP